MSYKVHYICRKCSLIATYLQLLQFTFAQNNVTKVDDWLKDNQNQLGGRAY